MGFRGGFGKGLEGNLRCLDGFQGFGRDLVGLEGFKCVRGVYNGLTRVQRGLQLIKRVLDVFRAA